MKRRLLAALLLAACLGMGGCGWKQEPAEEPGLLLGFSQLGSESSFRIGNTKDIEEQAEAAGISLMMKNANQKQENQIADIRSLIAYRVDVIAFSPIVEEGWDTVLTEARNAGIPVVLVDRTIQTKDESLYAGLIGSDFYQEGVMAGEYLIQKADALEMTTVNIVEIRGTENSTPMKQRQQGFMDTIRGDEPAVAAQIKRIHMEATNPLNANREDSLRAVIQVAYFAYRDYYLKLEELPTGEGYADIVYLPKPGKGVPALLVELKWNKGAAGAIRQIRDKSYPAALEGALKLKEISYLHAEGYQIGRASCRERV